MARLALTLALAATLAASPALAMEGPAAEGLTYRWSLGGIAGRVARVFIPGKGEGTLITVLEPDGVLESELRITSTGADEEEFWVYGARIDGARQRPLSAWNSYRFRGRSKRREVEIEQDDVIDIPSGIWLLRTDPPTAPRRMRLWTDGKIYPVLLSPGRPEVRTVGGRRYDVMHHEVIGLRVPGERRWKGALDLWLTADEEAVPVEIRFRRSPGKVHLRLVPEAEEEP